MQIINSKFSWFLAPVSWIYTLALTVRHLLYDEHVIPAYSPRVASICVGNLALGGTGKTPLVEYMVRLLKQDYKVAVLSRGYGRLTHGFRMADDNDTASTIGDEPMQIHTAFPDVPVAVSEKRVLGIKRLTKLYPDLDVVILDDAFQHRRINAGLNILLTEYNHLYVHDHMLPVGSLRDLPSRSLKADMVVVTKCPERMQAIDKRVVSNHLRLAAFQQLIFSHIQHAPLPSNGRALVVTGIAHPEPMIQYVESLCPRAGHICYNDHHTFRESDIQHILDEAVHYDYVLTTEKDLPRMAETRLPQSLEGRLFALPITMVLDEEFDRTVIRYVAESKRKKNTPAGSLRLQPAR